MIKKRDWEHWWQTSTSKMFPRNAKWVEGKQITTPTTESPVRKVIVEEALKSGDKVLDMGCATCIDYELFKDTDIHYTGIDITEKYLQTARELHPEIDVRQMNVIKTTFRDGEYPTTYMKSLVEHLHPDEWKDAVREGWRIARSKFMLCFVLLPNDGPSIYKRHPKGFYNNHVSKQELIELIESLPGFKSLEIREGIGRHDLYIVEKKPVE